MVLWCGEDAGMFVGGGVDRAHQSNVSTAVHEDEFPLGKLRTKRLRCSSVPV